MTGDFIRLEGYVNDHLIATDGGEDVVVAVGGPTGPVGATGPTGATGATGATGPAGPAFTWTIVSIDHLDSHTATGGEIVLADAAGGVVTVALGPAATVGSGGVVHVKKTDSTPTAVTVDPDGSETIDGSATASLTTQYESIELVSDGSDWWIL